MSVTKELLKTMPKYWAATIKDKLRLHGLQLGMKIKYIPKMLTKCQTLCEVTIQR